MNSQLYIDWIKVQHAFYTSVIELNAESIIFKVIQRENFYKADIKLKEVFEF